MFFWPLTAYMVGWYVYIPPLIIAVVSFIALILCFRKSKVGIMIFVPLLICNLLDFSFCMYRYRDCKFHGKAIIVRSLSIHNKEGLANPLGINILTPDYSDVQFCSYNDELVEVFKYGQGKALFSIEQKAIVLPFGQSLLTFAEVFEDYGLYGIMTKKGDVIIEPKYEMIEQLPGCFIVKYNNKYGTLTGEGQIKEKPQYDSYSNEGSFIFVEKNREWGILDNEGKEIVSPKYSAIKKIVRDDRFIIRSGDKYGVIDEKGHTIIDTNYDAIYYDSGYGFRCYYNWEDINIYDKIKRDINGKYLEEETYDGHW